MFSNFWGAISSDGYYLRSDDYVEIVEKRRTGIWNVPFVNSILLISKRKLQTIEKSNFKHNPNTDADMSFAQFCRDNVYFFLIFYIFLGSLYVCGQSKRLWLFSQ